MKRSAIVLIVANLILIGTLAAGVVLRSGRTAETAPFLELRPEAVDAIRISRGSDELVLERDRVEWRIVRDGRSYPARGDRVDGLLEALASARIQRGVTRREDQFDALGLGDSARRLTLAGDGFSLALAFGNTANSPEEVFAIDTAGDRAVVVTGGIDFYLTQSESFWAYLRLLPESVRGDEVSRLVASRDGQNLEVSDRVALRAVADLVGNGFYEGTLPSESEIAVELVMTDGRRFAIAVYDLGEFRVGSPRGPALPGAEYGGLDYTLADATADRLFNLLGF